jgi:hypothetical protein
MARLRNRICKADIWTDPELLRWHRDKRETYRGLWQAAEDSACLEDDPFGWKLLLWPSPLDADITVELLTTWRDELIAAGKLIPYEADGKRYLFIRTFHQHEHPRNPQSPDLPLPPWVRYEVKEVQRSDGRTNKISSYTVDNDLLPTCYRRGTESPVQSSPVQSSPYIPVGAANTPPTKDDFADIDFGDEEPTEAERGEIPYPPSQERGPSAASKKNGGPPVPENAGTLVAYLVDHAAEIGFALTDRKKGHFAKAIGDLVKAGADPPLVRRAIGVALRENKSPEHLVDVLNDLKGGGRGRSRTSDGRSTNGEW